MPEDMPANIEARWTIAVDLNQLHCAIGGLRPAGKGAQLALVRGGIVQKHKAQFPNAGGLFPLLGHPVHGVVFYLYFLRKALAFLPKGQQVFFRNALSGHEIHLTFPDSAKRPPNRESTARHPNRRRYVHPVHR